PYLSTYTMGAAELGLFPVLLLPLAVIGGYDTVELRSLLAAFLALLGLSAVELPVITQELRLFTYALLFGSILAGIGAYRVYTHLAGRYGRRRVVAGLVLLPGLLLVLQTQPDQHWQLGYDPGPVYSELEKQPAGRVMVETVNSSVYDSYALQGMLPVHTRHAAVNDVHLDSSPSASYILTLESWISTTMVHNPICRTCDTTAPPPLVDRRLDDLGVRYVLTRTGSAGERMAAAMHRIGPAGPYTLFENTDGYRLVEPVQREPVALVGTWQQWRHVNDRLFVSNLSVPVTWHRAAPDHRDRFSAVIRMGAGAATVVDRLRSISLQPTPPASVNATVTADRVAITANRSGPVRVKLSYLPTHRSQAALYAAAFNTMIVYPDPEATIRLDRPRPGQPRASDP
ncbi:MAG: hypothetical protein SVY41_00465, partial [Candidatus Nanohaloarchaea archaeon]|nr:hypothetical protein [Candidatus Nanohaloarchaea archaeon]